MAPPPAVINMPDELLFIKLAREIAIDLFDIETILKHHQISSEQWAIIKDNKRFQGLLESEVTAWESATNTHERSKLKAAAMLEEWFPEANTRLHDVKESLSAKTELAKLIARIAGMGLGTGNVEGGGGERFNITINLGADSKLQFQKEAAPKVIDVTPEE